MTDERLSASVAVLFEHLDEPLREPLSAVLTEIEDRITTLTQLAEVHSEALTMAQRILEEQQAQISRLEAHIDALEQRPMWVPIGGRNP